MKISRSRRRVPDFLPILLLWVTDKCNLHCKMCDQWRGSQSESLPELNTEEWLSVLDSASRLKTWIVAITGGEALLRPDIFEILTAIGKRGMACHLCTNGTTLTKTNILILLKTGVKSVSVSLDSDEPQIHNYLRGKSCFRQALDGIQLLRKEIPDLRISINFLATRANFKKMSKLIEMAKDLGVNEVNIMPLHTNLQHRNKPVETYHDLLFRANDIPELRVQLKKAKLCAKKMEVRIPSDAFLDGIPRFYTQAPPFHRCYAGYISCAVSPSGKVTPCADMDSELNVRNLPLDEIWKSFLFQQLRDNVINCTRRCWDTTNAELSIRCTISGLLREIRRNFSDLLRYR